MRRQLPLYSLLLGICNLLVGGFASADETGDAERPNIVWIFVEDMNDWYGCYGHDVVETPNVDALAERGVRFTRAYMPAGVCSATRSAISLGAMQTSYGVHNHRSSRNRVPGEVNHLPEGVKSVYEHLRNGGYYVISQGMNKDDFNYQWNPAKFYDERNYSKNLAAPSWRNRKEGQPFFAQIQLRGGKNSGKWSGKTDPADMKVAPYYPDVPVYREEYAHHYDCVKQTDNEVGQILDALKVDDLLENTIIFFWTDHGMRLPRHKQWLYEGGVRVPLVVAGPGLPHVKVRDDLVSGIDISATTLALAGVEIPDSMEGMDMFADGFHRDHVICARDRCDYTIDRVRAVKTERYSYLRNFLTDRPFMQPQYRDGRPAIEVARKMHKNGELDGVQAFIWNKTRVPEELYDLENDPHEIHNLADDPKYAKVLQEHRDILNAWIEETDDKGQYPESAASLRGVLKQWSKQAVNPEYEKVRE